MGAIDECRLEFEKHFLFKNPNCADHLLRDVDGYVSLMTALKYCYWQDGWNTAVKKCQDLII